MFEYAEKDGEISREDDEESEMYLNVIRDVNRR